MWAPRGDVTLLSLPLYYKSLTKDDMYYTVSTLYHKSDKWNCVTSFPIPTFMYMWTIFIFTIWVCQFSCSKIGRLILWIYKFLTDTSMWKLGDKILQFYLRNNEAAQFYFLEFINWNQAFILDFHRPFICSVFHRPPFLLVTKHPVAIKSLSRLYIHAEY